MSNEKITSEELKRWLDDKRDFILIDVMTPEEYEKKHLPGARRATVYEVTFLDQVSTIAPKSEKKIVVYAEKADSAAAQAAREKLLKAGYENVLVLAKGLSGWLAAGYPLEKKETVEIKKPTDGAYFVDREKSLLEWTGRGIGSMHHGTLEVKNSRFRVADGKLTTAEIVLDMTTIKNTDLADKSLARVLEAHLKSEDFFEVETYPEAWFTLTSSADILPESYSLRQEIVGRLKIKDVERGIDFPALIVDTEDGNFKVVSHLDFDRTLWNVRYGSVKFFEKLGMHLVGDIVSLELRLLVIPE
jgi:rhodanese-related sulfurtransferase/polyisoprenoid-binding protein YceI